MAADILYRIASAIATMEGYFRDGTLPRRLNNPGDLDFAGQIGATRSGKFHADGKCEYAQFDSPESGVVALYRQILLNIARGDSLTDLIGKWAPPTENNTKRYIAFVVDRCGVDPNVPLKEYLSVGKV